MGCTTFYSMLKNYLKIALRTIARHKAYSFINIFGLAIGMASSILILLWVQNELSYDRFNEHADQTYRIVADASGFKAAVNCAGMPEGLQAEMPVIRNTVRLSHQNTSLFAVGTQKFVEKEGFFVDSTFFDVFSYPLIRGDRRTALLAPDAVVISEDMARKYFGKEDPMGKIIQRDNWNNLRVTGVLANVPSNSHLHFNYLLSLSAWANDRDIKTRTWDNFNFYSYVVLDKHFDPTPAALAKLDQQIDNIYTKHEKNLKVKFHLQPLTAIHLYSNGYQVDLSGHGNVQYVNIFFIVAIFILAVACINFMNLATARSARRAKEVGLRKVVGAVRGQLVWQFLGESMLISFFALLMAVVLVYLALPSFNYLAGKTLSINLWDGKLLLMIVGIAAATGLISGSYPALFLSGFQPVKVLKGNLRTLGGNRIFRNGLVVMQFVVSIVLLVGTFVVYRQLTYIKERNMGFDRENVIYLSMEGKLWDNRQAFRAELAQNSLTSEFSVVSDLPDNLITGTENVDWPGKDPKSQIIIPSMAVSESFFDMMHMKLLAGRAFSSSFTADSSNFILNEKAVHVMGMTVQNAVGQQIKWQDNKGTVIGVVQDFNFKPIQQAIEPLVMGLNKWGNIVMVRARPGTTEATVKALEKMTKQLNPAYPFTYNFLDQTLAKLYTGEQQMGKIFNLFAVLAIFISCLGLYGLSAYMAEQRTKEIGVRKVLGASLFNIVRLLSSDFTRLIIVAMIIAIPLSWWAVNSWLQGFAYHVKMGWVIFILAPLTALVIAWITVSYESVRAAIVNPSKSLRSGE